MSPSAKPSRLRLDLNRLVTDGSRISRPFLVFCAFAIVCFLLIVGKGVVDICFFDVAHAQRLVKASARLIGDTITATLRLADGVLADTALLLRRDGWRDGVATAAFLQRRLEAAPNLRSLALLADNGSVLAVVGQPLPDLSACDCRKFVAPGGIGRFGMPVTAGNGERLIPLNRFVAGENGATATLLALIGAEALEAVAAGADLGALSMMELARADGLVLARQGAVPEDAVRAVRRLDPYPLQVTVAVANEEILQGWRGRAAADFVAAVSIMPLIGMLAWLLAGQVRGGAVARQAGQASENRFRTLVEAANDAILVVDADSGVILEANQKAGELFGWPVADLVGTAFSELQPPEDSERYRALLLQIGTRRGAMADDIFVRRADGRRIPVEFSAGVAVIGTKRLALAIFHDLTNRKRMEDALRKSETTFRSILNLTGEGFWHVDVKGRTIDANASLCRMLGYERDELLGKTPMHFVDDESAMVIREQLAGRTSAQHRQYQVTLLRKDGRDLATLFNATTLFDDAGAVASSFAMVTDLTALKESEARFKRLADATSEAVVVHENGRIIEFNRQLCDLTGYSGDALTDMSMLQLIKPEYVDLVRRRMRDQDDASCEAMGMKKDGSVFSMEIRSRALMLNGRAVRVAALRDLSRQRVDAEVRRQAEQRLQGAIVSIPEGFAYFDCEDRLALANDTCLCMHSAIADLWVPGVKFAHLVRENVERGGVIYNIGNKDDWIKRRLDFHRMPASTLEFETFDNRVIQIRENKTADGGTVIIYSDITELTRREQALRDSEARVRAIVETAADAIITIDHLGNLASFNPAAERIFGYDAPDIIGRNLAVLMGEGEKGRHESFPTNYLRGCEPTIVGTGREVIGRRKDGSMFPAELAVSEIKSDGQRLFAGILRDISERKRFEEALIAAKDASDLANRVKTEFLANMSHELRTPLNAIIGFSEILASEMLGPLGVPQYREYVGDIHESGKHLLTLISDILDVARIEVGQLTLREEEVDVAAVVGACLRMIHTRADKAGLTLHADLPQALPALIADERALKQMVLNLLSNAVKFTPKGGRVTVAVTLEPAPEGGLVLDVIDTGIGIAAENLNKVLEPFHQVDGSLTRKFEGAGLGLAIVKSLVEAHGGSIALASKVGSGTTISLRLPASRLAPAPAPVPVPGKQPAA